MVETLQRAPTYQRFEAPERKLFGPGPSPVDSRVLQAMTTPVLGHLDPLFLACMDDIKSLLRYTFETDNRMTLPISGTGSAGMESCIVNLIEPGDEAIICINGFFGERLLEMTERAGGKPVVVRAEWGTPIDRNKIEDALKSHNAKVVAIVQAETSTGVLQDLKGLGEMAHRHGALLIVDAVTALGTHKVGVDENQIDACYSCSQKGIGAPPGLAPVTFSERAVDSIRKRKTRVQSWYLDVTTIEKYWGSDRAYHHTAPISMNYALREGLRLLAEEGLEPRWARHELNHRAFVAGIDAMGLSLSVAPADRLWALNVVTVPEGVSEAGVRTRLLEDFNIEIGAGLGPFKGRVWRIGLMGFGSTRENVLMVLEALRAAMAREGKTCPSGVEAAESVYAASRG
ncbi:MAG TPA: alanine--glyoxylate aminotransferase family protein [Blastocatellia bacterium]|nr:alanine--glyoxylate aminotransferase family protein [Blastocatellia bacterium]